MFALVVLLGAAIAAIFANDGAALLLTPIVVAILARVDFPQTAALALIVATGFVADTTSLPLVISNLVNIVNANFFGVPFNRYAAITVPVDLVSLAATLAVLWLYYGRQIPRSHPTAELEAPATAIRDPLVFGAAFPLLAVLLVLAGRFCRSGSGAVIRVGAVLRKAPWQIVVFSPGMYLVVYGLRNAGLTNDLARVLSWLGGHGPWAAAIGTGFVVALLSSVMNNMPGVLVGALAIQQAHDVPPLIRELMIYANIIGCDLGPKFTPIGSLVTPLWLHVLGTEGRTITWGQYMRVGLTITPPVLLVTLAALAV